MRRQRYANPHTGRESRAIGAHDLHLVVDEQARLSAVQVSANAAAIKRRRSNGMEPFRSMG